MLETQITKTFSFYNSELGSLKIFRYCTHIKQATILIKQKQKFEYAANPKVQIASDPPALGDVGGCGWSENKQPCLQSVVRLEDRPSGEDYFISGSFYFNISKLTLLL